MKEQSSECKDNNAAIVKRMMPDQVWIELPRLALEDHNDTYNSGRWKAKTA